jgi:hypothetical protein
MRLLLWQQLIGSVIYVAAAPDARFHVVWCGESLAHAETLKEAISLATTGSLFRPSDGSFIDFLRVSPDSAKWMLFGQGGLTDSFADQPSASRLRAGPRHWPPAYEVARTPEPLRPVRAVNPGLRGKTPLERLARLEAVYGRPR